MSDLKNSIAETAAKLRSADQDYAKVASIHQQLGERQVIWRGIPDVIARLEALSTLFDARAAAGKQLSDLKGVTPVSRTNVKIDKQEVRFDVIRLFRFQAYVTTCWSIYDALWASVVPIVGDHQKALFLGGCITGNASKMGGPSSVLSRLYGWSAAFFYAVRNELVHSAASALEGGRVFSSPEVSFGYEISEEFLARMARKCAKAEWALNVGLSMRDGWPWSRELDVLLHTCQNDVDAIFGQVLQWTSEVLTRELAIMALAAFS